MVHVGRNEGYWRYVLAAVGLTTVTFSGAGYLIYELNPKEVTVRRDNAVEAREAGYHAGGSQCASSILKRLSGPKGARQKDACAKAAADQQQDRNNYIQVARSADAAFASSVYALDQARVAAIGGALGLITMVAAIAAAIFAGLAAYHTKRSADATKNQVDAMRGHLTLLPSNFTLANIMSSPTFGYSNFPPDRPNLLLQFQNGGNSGAVIAEIRAAHLLGFTIPDEPPFHKTPIIHFADQTIAASMFSPEHNLWLGDNAPSVGELNQVRNGTLWAWFYGIVQYRDAFGDDRETVWCMRTERDGSYRYWGGEKYNYSK